MSEPITVEQYRELINKGELVDPLIFMESVMNGQDPRDISSIYALVRDIDDFSGGEPSRSDWAEIVDHVVSRFKYTNVPLDKSLSAAKSLSEYIHPKKKQIELDDKSNKEDSSATPLTEEEIELFKEIFNDEF